MGVPISFLDKYCPEQFEIIWRGGDINWAENECDFFTPPSKAKSIEYRKQNVTWRIQNPYLLINDKAQTVYQRILIRRKK
jgi:phage host-nuclease inhibitor protein Gam